MITKQSLVTILLWCIVSNVATSCSTSNNQVLALNNLYVSTNGDQWEWNSDYAEYGIPWNFNASSPSDPCNNDWQGITCDNLCDVTGISLSGYNLDGMLPNTFNLLPDLKILDLSNNPMLVGGIPESLSNCIQLQTLILADNQLTGPFPSSLQLSLTSLENLQLSHNFLSGTISDNIGRTLSKLTVLQLGDNFFKGTLPSTINLLTELTQCVLSENQFNGTLPSLIGDLYNLGILAVDSNYLSGTIPESLTSLTKLSTLKLSRNRLKGSLPSNLGSLSALTTLNLGQNMFSGILPLSLFTIRSLSDLILNDNQFSGNLSSVLVSNLINLKSLQLQHNYFSGTLPSVLFSGALPKLEEIILTENSFTGSFPSDVLAAANNNIAVVQFLVDNNFLVGTIPQIFSTKFSKLQSLSLAYNYFNGSFANLNVGQWGSLEIFSISGNRFSGPIPSALYQLPVLAEVYLSDNLLTGSIASSIGQLSSSLIVWQSSNNFFTGAIPSTMMELSSLQLLDLSINHLSQVLPLEWGQLANLTTLSLSENSFNGTLPSSLTTLLNLKNLYLYRNKFTGQLPNNFSHLVNVQQLILFGNEFHGKLFHEVDFTSFNELTSLQVGQNYFTGPGFYPSDLGEYLKKLVDFDIDTNAFTGSFPNSLSSLEKVQWFVAYNNSLSGEINNIFAELQNLTTLMLQNNKLSGKIDHLVDSTQQSKLSIIDLSNNELSGSLPVSSIFNLPQLISFAAVKNCLTGSLSSVMCHANRTLQVLALDGISSADDCQNRIFPDIRSSKSYFLQQPLKGSIPNCLLTDMTVLTTLHLSGNGITGSLPDISKVSSALFQDFSVTYNLITGTIPIVLQEHPYWTNFDLSYNKLQGVLSKHISSVFSSSSSDNHTLALDNNRLSGKVPSTLLDARSINILEGNIFECDSTSSSTSNTNDVEDEGLPTHDPNVDSYECGSNEVNYSFYVWIIITGLVVSYGLILWFWPLLKHTKQLLVKEFDAYYEIFSLGQQQQQQPLTIPPNQQYIVAMGVIYTELRHWCASVTIFIVVVFLPTYLILSLFFSSYTHTYAWQLSLAYFSGIIPSVILTVMLIVFLTILYTRFPRPFALNIFSMKRSIDQQIGSIRYTFFDEGSRRLAMFYSSLFLVTLINFSIMVMVNMAYLYEISSSTTHSSATRKQGLAMAMALFNLLWNKIIFIVFDSKFFRYYVNPNTSHSAVSNQMNGFDDSTVNSILTTTILGTTLFNNVIAPCIAVACISSTCFYFAFQQAENVDTNYAVDTCGSKSFNTENLLCSNTQSVTFYTSYPPPFYYSYQCSSTLLANFAAIFIYRFLFVGIILPGWKIMCKSLQEFLVEKYGENHRLAKLVNDYTIPVLLRPITPKLILTESLVEKLRSIERNSKSQLHHERAIGESLMPMSLSNFPPFSCKENVVSVVTDIAIVLTFGVVFPPLAVVGCFAILAFTYFVQLSIGRLCYLSKFQLFLARYVDFVNMECRGMHLLLIKSLLTIPFLIATFWSLFLFDILGDEVGLAGAVWIIPFMTSIPIIIFVINYLIPSEDRDENLKIALGRRSESDSGKSPFHRNNDEDGYDQDIDFNGVSDGIQLRESVRGKSSLFMKKNSKQRQATSSNLRQSLLQESFQYDNPVFRTFSNQSSDIN